MKNFNIIALLGLSLICSPRAFGGQDAMFMMAQWAVEQKLDTPQSVQHIDKKYPFPPKNILSSLSLVNEYCFANRTNDDGVHTLSYVLVDCKQYVRPKIIEFFSVH
jgi:hypothetical protein